MNSRLSRTGLCILLLTASPAFADCTLTNTGIKPLNELGFMTYLGQPGGLYPGGGNARPPAHETSGVGIGTAIEPLDGAGNVDTNSGKIVLLSIGMSNVTQEWATKGPSNFTAIATADPSLDPHVVIADGAIGGQDAPKWTNLVSTNWSFVITQRLVFAGATSNQVQAIWLKEAIGGPALYGAFPAHAQLLHNQMAMILRNAKSHFPNLKLAYVSSRTRAYTAVSSALNPEPFAFEGGFSTRWLIQDQIYGTNNLNFNSALGPVVAPWISWGPYLWADGTTVRSDGFTWLCNDLEFDFTHPNTNGVAKVASQLHAFFKTDVTTTPWFLKPSGAGAPTCAPTASVTNGPMPLTVNFTASELPGSAPLYNWYWTFGDGDFSTNANPTKIYRSAGLYYARFTVTDTNGNTAQGMKAIKVNSTLSAWTAGKFTPQERSDTNISGTLGNPDGDFFPNLLEYAMGLEPKTSDPANTVSTTLSNNVFTLTFPHYQPADDAPLSVEASSDLINWNTLTPTQSADLGLIEMLTIEEMAATNTARFFRFKSVLQ